MAAIAIVLGAILGYAAIRFRVEDNPLVDKIDAVLPQTQCGQCSYPGCKPYATAIAAGEADINRCPPGGEEGIQKLACVHSSRTARHPASTWSGVSQIRM